jgi:hypothetical protein
MTDTISAGTYFGLVRQEGWLLMMRLCRVRSCLKSHELITIINDGSHIQTSSLLRVISPHLLKNLVIPIGETRIGLHGKRYLVLSNGDRRAKEMRPEIHAKS